VTHLQKLIELLHELEAVTKANSMLVFSGLFSKGVELLKLDDRAIAEEFDASMPTIRRWKNGETVPRVSFLVLKFLAEAIEKEIHKLSEN
jgi:hypothetical protein